METQFSPLGEFTDAVPLKGGNTNDCLITREATDNGSSQDRDRYGKSRFNGITLPSSRLNPSRDGIDLHLRCQVKKKYTYINKIRGSELNLVRKPVGFSTDSREGLLPPQIP